MTKIELYTSEFEKEVKDIFYLSSSVKNFKSSEHKEQFFMNWCGDYIENFPLDFYLMKDTNTNKLLGYLSGCLDSKKAQNCLHVPKYEIFSDLFQKFPAHFHINFHPETRGLGLGSQLVNFFCDELRNKKINGVHLVTSTDARNKSFYNKLHFLDHYTRLSGATELLLMGKKLD